MKPYLTWRSLKHFFAPPIFPDPEQTRAARWLNIALGIIIVSLLIAIATLFVPPHQTKILDSYMISDIGALVIALFVWFLARRGYVRVATTLLLAMLFVIITYVNVVISQSINSPAVIIYFAMIPLAGLLLGRRSMNVFAILCVATISIMFYLEQHEAGVGSAVVKPFFDDLTLIFLTLAMNTILLNVSIRRAEEKTEEIRQTATMLSLVNEQLQTSQIKLEQAQAELEARV
ncbi:MAG: hypothetical protein NT075_36330, partial [Chloroflexi bacterium]|nr:hypothetical protein [Chloroflexota bacterium]